MDNSALSGACHLFKLILQCALKNEIILLKEKNSAFTMASEVLEAPGSTQINASQLHLHNSIVTQYMPKSRFWPSKLPIDLICTHHCVSRSRCVNSAQEELSHAILEFKNSLKLELLEGHGGNVLRYNELLIRDSSTSWCGHWTSLSLWSELKMVQIWSQSLLTQLIFKLQVMLRRKEVLEFLPCF